MSEDKSDRIVENKTVTIRMGGVTKSIQGPPTEFNNRITITGEAILQRLSSEEDHVIPMQGFIDLSTKDEPMKRSLDVGSTWSPIDYGWVTKPTIVILRNHVSNADRTPKEALAEKLIYLRQVGATAPFYLPHNQSIKLHVDADSLFEIRSESSSKVVMLVVPE